MRLSTLVPLLFFAALAAVFGAYLYQVGPGGKDISQLPSTLLDNPAPSFRLPPIEGSDIGGLETADLKGKVALVNVFASWCPPCHAEHPILMQMAANGVTIYGINNKDKPADARAFLDKLGNPYKKIGADPRGRVSIDWGVQAYPETFIVDRDGRIRYKHIGPIMPHDVDERIMPLVRQLSQ